MQKLEFGYKCKDIITGFEGILETRCTFITGCDRVKLINGNKEDKGTEWFDVPILKVIDEGIYNELQNTSSNKYNDIDEALYDFGILAKDKVSGFKGTIIGKSISISGDISYSLCPSYNKKSKDNSAVWYDEGRIEVVNDEKQQINTNKKRTGGAVPNLKIR